MQNIEEPDTTLCTECKIDYFNFLDAGYCT